MRNLTALCFVRIKHPTSPEERGRQLLVSADVEGDECRVGLRDGSVRSYMREEIEAIAEEETPTRNGP